MYGVRTMWHMADIQWKVRRFSPQGQVVGEVTGTGNGADLVGGVIAREMAVALKALWPDEAEADRRVTVVVTGRDGTTARLGLLVGGGSIDYDGAKVRVEEGDRG